MLKKLKRFFTQNPGDTLTQEEQAHRLHVATAALLFEIARADLDISDIEKEKISAALKKQFNLSDALINEVVQQAEIEVEQAVSLHPFTKLIHDNYSLEEKHEIIYFLWVVAYSDNELDMYEESLIRKISDLLYVTHKDFIIAKLRAQDHQKN